MEIYLEEEVVEKLRILNEDPEEEVSKIILVKCQCPLSLEGSNISPGQLSK